MAAVPVVAELDVASIKKAIAADIAALSKTADEDVRKAADDYRIRDAQSGIIVKTYARDQHESFRSAEENKLAERVVAATKKLSTDVEAMVEQAFVEVLKRQNEFDASIKKDIALFKTQFNESITKMLQGKSATPITYSSTEAVAKPVADVVDDMPLALPPVASKKKASAESDMKDDMAKPEGKKLDKISNFTPLPVGPTFAPEVSSQEKTAQDIPATPAKAVKPVGLFKPIKK